MAAGLVPGSRASALTRSGTRLPAAWLLGAVVVLAAALGGAPEFSGPRWYPRLSLGGHASRARRLAGAGEASRRHTGAHVRTAPLPGWLLVLAIVLVGALAAWVLARLWRDRRSALPSPGLPVSAVAVTPAAFVPEPEPEQMVLASGIELALRALDEPGEPADAVVRAWVGLQESAAQAGVVRSPSEGPTEFTTRVLSRAFADERAIRTLLQLYLRTRFGDHPVTAADVDTVREALERLSSSWREPEAAGR